MLARSLMYVKKVIHLDRAKYLKEILDLRCVNNCFHVTKEPV
jgi:hypothetical protein